MASIPFTLREPRYDEATYMGRFWSIFEASNIRYAFKSNQEVKKQYALVKAQEAREKAQVEKTGQPHVNLSSKEVETLRHAVNITKAAIHPDTE
jgi:3-dehydroquinate synthase class II